MQPVKRTVGTFLCCVLFLAASATGAGAASLLSVGNFKAPIYLTSDPGNPDRLFVVQREGQIVTVENGTVSEFADLSSLVGCCGGESGLLSIALANDFHTSGRFFVDYTDKAAPAGSIHVDELQAGRGTVSLATRRELLTIPHPEFDNHYGGQLQVGPEGYLYVSTGDGGNGNDEPGHNAQRLEGAGALLGKILRLDPNPSGVLPYTVPPGNPFAFRPAPYSTVFSYGLRNPFRFSFDRLTHDLVIGDVGQGKREEVDWAPAPGLGAGADYGWNCFEGRLAGPATDHECATPPATGFVPPTFDYPHEDPGSGAAHGQAIIGGYVVRDPSLGNLDGRYLYGDLVVGELRSLSLAEPSAPDRGESLSVPNLNSFGEDACGRLYAISGDGPVFRLVGPTAAGCTTANGGPVAAKPLAASTIGIRAVTRRVRKAGRAQITAFVSPCAGRRGEAVALYRGRRKLDTRRLDRACLLRFLPRIRHRSRFRAVIAADDEYLAATSRKLGIRIFHPKKRHGKSESGIHIPPGVGHR